MKFRIEDKFVNDYLYSQSQKKKQIEKRKQKMRIRNEIENGFSKMFEKECEKLRTTTLKRKVIVNRKNVKDKDKLRIKIKIGDKKLVSVKLYFGGL